MRLGRARDVDGEKLLVQCAIGVRARAALNRECTRGVGRCRLDTAGRVAAQRREVVSDARVERRYYARSSMLPLYLWRASERVVSAEGRCLSAN